MPTRPDDLADRLGEDPRLDLIADRLAGLAEAVVGHDPDRVTLLSGSDLGHPAHPALTDVAIGLLTSGTVLDLLPGSGTRRSADVLVALGTAATLPTVATGLSDWKDTTGTTRRLGAAHAASNGVAAALYTWSLAKRVRGRRGQAVLLSLLGAAAMAVGGYLGSHLAYRRGIGVDANAFTPSLDDWTPAMALDELPQGQPTMVTVAGVDVLLYRDDGDVRAIANRCSHLGGPLDQGHVHTDDGVVSCPWHHSSFRLADGEVVRGPASHPQPCFATDVRDGVVHVRSARDD